MARTSDDIEARTVAYARDHGLAGAISEVTGRTVAWVLGRMATADDGARVPDAFHDRWPDDAALGKFKVVQCLRLGLVPRLARTLGRTIAEVRARMTPEVHDTRLRKLFAADWPAK